MAAENAVKDKEKSETVAAPEAPITHPLSTKWSLWVDFYASKSGGDWRDNLKLVHTVATVEEWWALYNHIRKPSELAFGGNISLFRVGVRPVPDEGVNKEGGMYVVRRFDESSFDTIWLYSVLFCIGEVSPKDNELVLGTVASVKKSSKGSEDSVSMWIKTTEKKDLTAVKRLGKLYKEKIGLGARKMRLPFKPHDKSEIADSKKKHDPTSTSTAPAAPVPAEGTEGPAEASASQP